MREYAKGLADKNDLCDHDGQVKVISVNLGSVVNFICETKTVSNQNASF